MKKKIDRITKKILSSVDSPGFVGKGKLKKYKNKKDSWILNQLDKGVDRGIKLHRDDSGQWTVDGYKGKEPLIARLTNLVDKIVHGE